MKATVIVGMKVVPHDKNGLFPGEGLGGSNEWCRAKNIGQQYLYVNLYDGDIVICSAEKRPFKSGDYFLASDLTPYEEKYVCNIPGVTTDFVPGKKYWISDISEQDAVEAGCVRTYVVTIGGKHRFVGSDHIGTSDYPNEEFTTTTWKYAVDPDTYKEPETEMTVEEVAEALRSKGVITGKLKIKE